MKIDKRLKPVKITMIDGRVLKFDSLTDATRALNLRHGNALGSYWSKGKSLDAMRDNGIERVEFI